MLAWQIPRKFEINQNKNMNRKKWKNKGHIENTMEEGTDSLQEYKQEKRVEKTNIAVPGVSCKKVTHYLPLESKLLSNRFWLSVHWLRLSWWWGLQSVCSVFNKLTMGRLCCCCCCCFLKYQNCIEGITGWSKILTECILCLQGIQQLKVHLECLEGIRISKVPRRHHAL